MKMGDVNKLKHIYRLFWKEYHVKHPCFQTDEDTADEYIERVIRSSPNNERDIEKLIETIDGTDCLTSEIKKLILPFILADNE